MGASGGEGGGGLKKIPFYQEPDFPCHEIDLSRKKSSEIGKEI